MINRTAKMGSLFSSVSTKLQPSSHDTIPMKPMPSNFDGYHGHSSRNFRLHPNGHGTENWFRGLLSFVSPANSPIRLPQRHYNASPSVYQAHTALADTASASTSDDECGLCVSTTFITFGQCQLTNSHSRTQS